MVAAVDQSQYQAFTRAQAARLESQKYGFRLDCSLPISKSDREKALTRSNRGNMEQE